MPSVDDAVNDAVITPDVVINAVDSVVYVAVNDAVHGALRSAVDSVVYVAVNDAVHGAVVDAVRAAVVDAVDSVVYSRGGMTGSSAICLRSSGKSLGQSRVAVTNQEGEGRCRTR